MDHGTLWGRSYTMDSRSFATDVGGRSVELAFLVGGINSTRPINLTSEGLNHSCWPLILTRAVPSS